MIAGISKVILSSMISRRAMSARPRFSIFATSGLNLPPKPEFNCRTRCESRLTRTLGLTTFSRAFLTRSPFISFGTYSMSEKAAEIRRASFGVTASADSGVRPPKGGTSEEIIRQARIQAPQSRGGAMHRRMIIVSCPPAACMRPMVSNRPGEEAVSLQFALFSPRHHAFCTPVIPVHGTDAAALAVAAVSAVEALPA